MAGTPLAIEFTHVVESNRADGAQSGITMCKPSPTVLSIPSRWTFEKQTHAEAIQEIDTLAQLLVTGAEALSGLYLRICDTIRKHELTPDEIRDVLGKHFPPPRVSEFVRIAQAPPEVYRRYHAGFVGFRATLAACRGYRITADGELHHRKIRRAAERLVQLMGSGCVSVRGHHITVDAAALMLLAAI